MKLKKKKLPERKKEEDLVSFLVGSDPGEQKKTSVTNRSR